MKRTILFLLAAITAWTPLPAAESDEQVEARKVALDLAGAFSNDGFKLRDGFWTGSLKQGENAVVAVNLYAGNQYWFSVGADQEVKKFSVLVYDEAGQPVPVETFEAEDKAAAGYLPTVSGQYFVSITPTEANTPTFCLVYSYK